MIHRICFTSLLFAAGAIACSGVGSEPESASQSGELSSEATCRADADCPASSFCDDMQYGPWSCREKRSPGAWCGSARECKSGTCTNYTCAAPPPTAPACVAVGSRCRADAECCNGYCNDIDFAYGYGPAWSYCAARQADGSSCWSNVECVSGNCDQYECRPK